MSQQKEFTINRTKYNDIKKMDRQQMDSYLNEVYQKGIEAGKKLTEKVATDINQVREVVCSVKGIGKIRAETIIVKLEELLTT